MTVRGHRLAWKGFVGDYSAIFQTRGGDYNEAQARVPGCREQERRLLAERLALESGQRVLDAPAGGGYLADGLARDFEGLQILCVEPSPTFADGIDRRHLQVRGEPTRLPLGTGTLDRVGSLAGVHHLEDRARFFAECARVLRPGGRVAVADVAAGTAVARFLNGPVDRLTETGHSGRFFETGEATALLEGAGFVDVKEEVEHFAWEFPDTETLIRFCHQFFGMVRADLATVRREIYAGFEIRETSVSAALPWSLVYAVGTRA